MTSLAALIKRLGKEAAQDSTLQSLHRSGIPINQESYLALMGEEFLMTPLDQMDAELLAELPEYFSKLPKAKGQSRAKSRRKSKSTNQEDFEIHVTEGGNPFLNLKP